MGLLPELLHSVLCRSDGIDGFRRVGRTGGRIGAAVRSLFQQRSAVGHSAHVSGDRAYSSLQPVTDQPVACSLRDTVLNEPTNLQIPQVRYRILDIILRYIYRKELPTVHRRSVPYCTVRSIYGIDT